MTGSRSAGPKQESTAIRCCIASQPGCSIAVCATTAACLWLLPLALARLVLERRGLAVVHMQLLCAAAAGLPALPAAGVAVGGAGVAVGGSSRAAVLLAEHCVPDRLALLLCSAAGVAGVSSPVSSDTGHGSRHPALPLWATASCSLTRQVDGARLLAGLGHQPHQVAPLVLEIHLWVGARGARGACVLCCVGGRCVMLCVRATGSAGRQARPRKASRAPHCHRPTNLRALRVDTPGANVGIDYQRPACAVRLHLRLSGRGGAGPGRRPSRAARPKTTQCCSHACAPSRLPLTAHPLNQRRHLVCSPPPRLPPSALSASAAGEAAALPSHAAAEAAKAEGGAGRRCSHAEVGGSGSSHPGSRLRSYRIQVARRG